MGSLVLLDLLGGVALLLWGLHMVLSGVLRAFGPDLRRFLGKALSNRFTAFGAGVALTALLQSSTATGLMTTSLAADGAVSLVPALAIMLGANVGTTLIVQVLSFDISAVAPVLLVIGLITFRAGGQSLTRALGRIAIGLGLMLLALHILVDTLAPAEQAPAARVVLGSMTHDPVLCIVIAAALTWAAHSSVAVVLLVMSLAYSHFITGEAALALVLGANLGSAINPLIEGGIRGDPASRRLPFGNLLNRLVGILLVLPFLPPLAHELTLLQPDAAKMTAEFHMLFNVALAALFIGPLDAVAALLVRVLPERTRPADPSVAALSRRSRVGDALPRARQRRARDAAHGRHRRGHAASGHGRDHDQRPQARRRGVADGQCRRPPHRSDQALSHQADARQPRRARGPPRHGDRLVHHQSRAYRRHHRQESVRARRSRRSSGATSSPPKARRNSPPSTSGSAKTCRPPSASS